MKPLHNDVETFGETSLHVSLGKGAYVLGWKFSKLPGSHLLQFSKRLVFVQTPAEISFCLQPPDCGDVSTWDSNGQTAILERPLLTQEGGPRCGVVS